jgi:hypothetical protein
VDAANSDRVAHTRQDKGQKQEGVSRFGQGLPLLPGYCGIRSGNTLVKPWYQAGSIPN